MGDIVCVHWLICCISSYQLRMFSLEIRPISCTFLKSLCFNLQFINTYFTIGRIRHVSV
jgi:hypothetical protein